jgi:sialic acid synthase SpsE
MNISKIYIIAEIGVNHNGDIGIAKKLILSAKKNGADAVKFQTFNAERLSFKDTPKVKYQEKNSIKKQTHYEMLKELELNENQHYELINFCKKKKIDFLSTPYDVEDAKFLIKCGIKTFKTSSADIIDYFLHKYLSLNAKEVIISTGMCSYEEISNTIKLYKKSKTKISLLHCVSNYPCSDKSLNLRNIPSLYKKFKVPIGFSDHSQNILSPVIAISLGCKIIERHITLDKNMKGPDHFASDNPEHFKLYVQRIRNAELILGSKEKKTQKEEMEMKKISRKGIYYCRDISKEKKVTLNDLYLKRPWTNNTIFSVKKIIKKKLKKNVKQNSRLSKYDFKKN